jgi:hypothetical protein
MNFIIDPISLNRIYIYKNQGKALLKRYISHYQLGGSNNVDYTEEDSFQEMFILDPQFAIGPEIK